MSTPSATELTADDLRAAQGGLSQEGQRVAAFFALGVGGFIGVVFWQAAAYAYENMNGGGGQMA